MTQSPRFHSSIAAVLATIAHEHSVPAAKVVAVATAQVGIIRRDATPEQGRAACDVEIKWDKERGGEFVSDMMRKIISITETSIVLQGDYDLTCKCHECAEETRAFAATILPPMPDGYRGRGEPDIFDMLREAGIDVQVIKLS